MSKEKQIEEMARDLENHTCMSQFQAEIASKMLYAKGYRKQSEVAREIITNISDLTTEYDYLNQHSECYRFGYLQAMNKVLKGLLELKKKYTEGGAADGKAD